MAAAKKIVKSETFVFRAETSKLLRIIINTLYPNKEIFLREIISNSSDALDKIRQQSLTDITKLGAQPELFIRIVADKANKTLSIIDSGVGMTKADLVSNLGTIARSGTKEFIAALEAGADMRMIGEFGVGFYSAYLVSKKVIVTTKHNEDEQYVWESQAGSFFTITRDTGGEPLGRGTKTTLFLNEEQLEYLENKRLKDIVRKHSEFISHPIYLWAEKTAEKEIGAEEYEESKSEKEEGNVDHMEKESNEKKVVVSHAWSLINEQKSIWHRKANQITKEEYASFYKCLTGDSEDHLAVEHFSVKGQLTFKVIIFVPRRAPLSMLDRRKKKNNIKFYVRRVFITDNCEELIPKWLGFLRGVVHSDDFPVLTTREMPLQKEILMDIRKKLVKKCIALFLDMAENKEEYSIFYKNFSKNVKMGFLDNTINYREKQKLATLLRFHSTKSGEEMTCFKDYITRMKEGQQNIYYITGESSKALENSPFLERLKRKGMEVLFMVDDIDKYMVWQLGAFAGKKLVSVTTEGLTLEDDEEEKKSREEKVASFKGLCKVMEEILGDRVKEVVVSNRLVDSPCVLPLRTYGSMSNMDKCRKKIRAEMDGTAQISGMKIMEINPDNGIIEDIRKRAEADKEDKSVKDLVTLLYEISLITSGFTLDDLNAFAVRIYRLLRFGLEIDQDETGGDQESRMEEDD